MSEDKAAVEKLHASYGRMKDELSQVIVGQHEVVEQVLMAMLGRVSKIRDALFALCCLDQG